MEDIDYSKVRVNRLQVRGVCLRCQDVLLGAVFQSGFLRGNEREPKGVSVRAGWTDTTTRGLIMGVNATERSFGRACSQAGARSEKTPLPKSWPISPSLVAG